MIKVRCDITNWKKSTDQMQAARPESRLVAARGMANVASAAFERMCSRDTGRLLRGWMEAAGEAGAEMRVLPALQASRAAGKIYDRIVGQWVLTHKRRLALEKHFNFLYPPGSKLGAAGQKMRSDLRWLTKRDARLKEEVDKFLPVKDGPVIVIGGRGLNPYATVRTTVYGGRGFIKDVNGQAVLYLWNREPHASIVNANTQLNRKVGLFIKAMGGRQVGAAYMKKLGVARARSLEQFSAISK